MRWRPLNTCLYTACSALTLFAAAAQAENYVFNFSFPDQGSGTVRLEGDPGATQVYLAESSIFEARFELGDQTWTEADYVPQSFNEGTLRLETDNSDGTDWYWNDSNSVAGDDSIAVFDNGRSELAFDEGDQGGRVYRIDGIVEGDYSASTSSSPQPPVTPDPAPVTQEQIDQSLQAISVNANTSSTAAVIGTACPQTAPGSRFQEDCTPIVLGALANNAEANDQAGSALVAVTAEQSTVSLSSSRASLSSQAQNLATRLSALRAGATGLSVGGLAFEVGGQDGFGFPIASSLIGAAGGAASADGSSILDNEKIGVFINGTVTRADKDATSNEEGFDVSGWAITGGVDYRFLDNAVAGLAVGYYSSSTDIDNSGGDLDTDGYSVSLYGTYYHDERLYVDGIVTYGNNDYDQKRNIRYQVGPVRVNQIAKADYDGDQWSAAISGGYSLSTGPWTYGPVVRLEYVSASVDGYNERISNPNANGGAWAASLGDVDQESLTSTIGADLSRAFSTQWGVVLPQLHLGWVHEYRSDAIAVNGSFIEDPTRSIFSIEGDKPDSDYFNARLGVSAQFAGGTSAFLYYNKVFGYRDLDVDTFGAGVRLTF
jgi:outer membrane autotransporter protein